MSCTFLQLGFAVAVWEADTAKKCSIAAAPFYKPSCVATRTSWLGLAAITTNQISTDLGTDREADTTGRTSRHATAAQLHMLAAIPVAPVLSCHVKQTPAATRTGVGVLLGLQGHDHAEFGLFHQLLDEDRGARFGCQDGHCPPGPGYGDIEEPDILRQEFFLRNFGIARKVIGTEVQC